MREPKEDRFRRIAEARVNKIIDMVKLLGNCSYKGNYAYSEQQVEQFLVDCTVNWIKQKNSIRRV